MLGFLAKPIEALLRRQGTELLEDKSKRVELGADGRRHVITNFTWAATAARTVEVYERARLAHR